MVGTSIKKEMFATTHFNLLTKDNIVGDSNTFVYSFNNFKWFSTIIKMPKLYEVERVGNTIKTITIDIVEFDFFHRNGSMYRDTIEVVYILKMSVDFISIGKLQFNNIIYNRFNRIIMIENTRQKVIIFT